MCPYFKLRSKPEHCHQRWSRFQGRWTTRLPSGRSSCSFILVCSLGGVRSKPTRLLLPLIDQVRAYWIVKTGDPQLARPDVLTGSSCERYSRLLIRNHLQKTQKSKLQRAEIYLAALECMRCHLQACWLTDSQYPRGSRKALTSWRENLDMALCIYCTVCPIWGASHLTIGSLI